MPYCSKCGTEVDFNTQYCPKCGAPQSTSSYQPAPQRSADPYDSGSIGWFILGFFVPLVGFILYLVWASDRPKSAKMSGLGALVGILLSVVFSVIYFAILMSLMSSSSPDSILSLL